MDGVFDFRVGGELVIYADNQNVVQFKFGPMRMKYSEINAGRDAAEIRLELEGPVAGFLGVSSSRDKVTSVIILGDTDGEELLIKPSYITSFDITNTTRTADSSSSVLSLRLIKFPMTKKDMIKEMMEVI